MKILALLFPLFALTATAQRTRIKEIRYPIKGDTLVYPRIITADSATSRRINQSIRKVFFDEEFHESIQRSLAAWAKEYNASDLSYSVTVNDNGLLSLYIHQETSRAYPSTLDSFRSMVLHEKQQELILYYNDLPGQLQTKQIDSADFQGAADLVADCMDSADLDRFSLSPEVLEVIDPCEFPHVVQGMEPYYQLKYSYNTLAPFLKPEFQRRIATVKPDYRLIHFTSPHNCFPDTGRNAGHLDGDHIFQPRKGHYDDSSVLLVVPRAFRPKQKIDLVFWYHGWHNNIDTALNFYGLARQFAASQVNAILVLPEAGKNVADSYGGKMNQKGMFRLLTNDVISQLKKQHLAPSDAEPGNITLAGHSGAFLVIANILDNGDQPISDVFLFDALYSHVPSFLNWIGRDTAEHRFIHWFTNKGGGTDEVSDTMMRQLKEKGWPFRLVEESNVTAKDIARNKILFIHSPREHNVIINDPDDFQLLLENSRSLTR